MKFFAFLTLSFLAFSNLFAQDFFQGTIQFKVELDGPEVELLMMNEPNDKMTMHIKDANYIVRLHGGKYPKLFLFVADSNYEYSMDMKNSRAFRYSPHTDLSKAKETEPVMAVATGKKETVNNIECDEYRLKKGNAIFYYYVNDQYRVNLDAFPEKCRAKPSFLANGLEGRIPIKTVKKTKDLTVVTTAKSLQRKEFKLEQFLIPPNFEVKNRDYRY
jgi:hypothetical protein